MSHHVICFKGYCCLFIGSINYVVFFSTNWKAVLIGVNYFFKGTSRFKKTWKSEISLHQKINIWSLLSDSSLHPIISFFLFSTCKYLKYASRSNDYKCCGAVNLISIGSSGVARAFLGGWPIQKTKRRKKMKKIWGKMGETTEKWRKIEEMFLSCPHGSGRLATALIGRLRKYIYVILHMSYGDYFIAIHCTLFKSGQIQP